MGVKEIYVIYESKRKLCTKHVRIRVYFCDVLKSNTNIKKYDAWYYQKKYFTTCTIYKYMHIYIISHFALPYNISYALLFLLVMQYFI